MEAFYQESGRAGRDQLPSRSLLYYGVDDRKRMVGLLDTLLLFFLLDLFSHCNLCQEFILRKSVSKKSQSSSSQEESSKMSLIAFNQVISNLRAFPLTRSVAMHHAIIYLQNGMYV